MTEIKHTPGPWTVATSSYDDRAFVRFGGNSKNVYTAILSTADARLIAAAPDMLEALQLAIRSRWLSIDIESNRTQEACDIRSAICAAIDKATGAQ